MVRWDSNSPKNSGLHSGRIDGHQNGDGEVGAETLYAYTPELGDMVYGRMHLSGYDPHVTVNLKLGVRIPVWEC